MTGGLEVGGRVGSGGETGFMDWAPTAVLSRNQWSVGSTTSVI